MLIVGIGGAGLRVALEIIEKEPNARVILATKGKFARSEVSPTICLDSGFSWYFTIYRTRREK